LPSVDEWYKAAYFDPAINYYYEWPTGSDQGLAEAQSVGGGWTLPPGGTAPGTAVYYGHHGPADIDNAGGLSPYGTMAQGGNVFEWQENGMVRGGSWGSFYFYGGWLALSSREISSLSGGYEAESTEVGFRVASSATLTNPTGITPLITSTNSFSGKVGVAFSQTATANGDAPIVFSGTNLPGGLSIATNGLITGTPTNAGTFSSTLTASNLFGSTNQTATFTIAKGDQTITLPVLPPNIYPGGSSFTLNASASSGLPVTYTSSNPGVLAISGNTATPGSVGTTVLTISQAGDANWNPAISVSLTLTLQARDSDGDGVPDDREIKDGTNPNDPNSYNGLSQGLVAYYPFNGNANDESG
ncbi:MAG: hypothetical protein EBZ78_13635, partial [Verrucomicrobia bacterium]|nr:hypothetical protein [Verrucomicrobiota bacterium]